MKNDLEIYEVIYDFESQQVTLHEIHSDVYKSVDFRLFESYIRTTWLDDVKTKEIVYAMCAGKQIKLIPAEKKAFFKTYELPDFDKIMMNSMFDLAGQNLTPEKTQKYYHEKGMYVDI